MVRVGGESIEGGPGDIVIGPAGTPHGFTNAARARPGSCASTPPRR